MADHDGSPNTSVAAGAPVAQATPNLGPNDTQDNYNGAREDDRRGGEGRGEGRGRGRGRRSRGGGRQNDGYGSKRKNQDHGRAAYGRNRWSEDNRLKKPRSGEEGEKQEDEEDAKEERKPKRKVAVLIGYCGTGYRGMQLNPPHKSIEGDIFEALVNAGAISRANSNDPKKSSLVRCARTDKGVHAAGNVISLKLIIEDPDIVAKINAHLPEQIRVWGIVRTIGSFSCYQQCDSRRYEYLVPSHCFLPPHPTTYLAKLCRETAAQQGDIVGFESRQKEVEGWWDEVNRKTAEMFEEEETYSKALEEEESGDENDDMRLDNDGTLRRSRSPENDAVDQDQKMTDPKPVDEKSAATKAQIEDLRWKIRQFHRSQKREYRISPERLARVRKVFGMYIGTWNFHNYTVQKDHKDASAKRFIKDFEVLDPIIINNTEWLSLRVHGQSFMMHQIRKMVGMAMMAVRTGCPLVRISETLGPTKVSIPKAPSLGLLLESPVFESYNNMATSQHSREPIDFDIHKTAIDEFRERMIYSKLFAEEEKANVYTGFVHFLDSYRSPLFSYLTSAGLRALEDHKEELEAQRASYKSRSKKVVQPGPDSEDEDVGSDREAG